MAKKTVVYKGRSADIRVLNKKDLVGLGLDESVEFKQTDFWKGTEVEVEAAVADILLQNDEFQGEFVEAEDKVPVDKQASVNRR